MHFSSELDTTQTFLRDVLCPVRGRNEYLWQMAELFEPNACKLSRTMIFLTDDQKGNYQNKTNLELTHILLQTRNIRRGFVRERPLIYFGSDACATERPHSNTKPL